MGEPAYCDRCCAKEHDRLPFHRIEVWKGTHYSPAWLWQAGVCIFLGHRGLPCPNIQPVHDDDMDGVFLDQEFQDILMSDAAPPGRTWMQKKVITVVHTNGVHHLPVGLCGCPNGMSEIDGECDIVLGLLCTWPCTACCSFCLSCCCCTTMTPNGSTHTTGRVTSAGWTRRSTRRDAAGGQS